jgi:hypothetical protein
MVQQQHLQSRIFQNDFVLNNLQSVAICSALAKNVKFDEVMQRIFGGFEADTHDTILNHNVRSSYLAGGICLLYAKNEKVRDFLMEDEICFSSMGFAIDC